MKQPIFILLCLSLFAFAACKKKKEEKPKSGTTPFVDSFSLKQDGVFFSTNSPDVSSNNSWIGIIAGTIGETGNYYQIGLKKNLLPGTYEYTGATSDPMVFYIISDQLTFSEETGSITVLSNDTVLKKIEFEFEMLESNSHSDTIFVTEGHTKISY